MCAAYKLYLATVKWYAVLFYVCIFWFWIKRVHETFAILLFPSLLRLGITARLFIVTALVWRCFLWISYHLYIQGNTSYLGRFFRVYKINLCQSKQNPYFENAYTTIMSSMHFSFTRVEMVSHYQAVCFIFSLLFGFLVTLFLPCYSTLH